MVSLAATLARRSIYYPRPIASLPDILMIDVPRRFADRGLARGRFYPIMVETPDEQSELEAFLSEDRDSLVSPGILDERLSTLPKEHLTIAHYRPYVQLCQWPAEFVARASGGGRQFARGAYTFELFHGRKRLEAASKLLLASLDRRHALNVEVVFPDWSQDPEAPSN